MNRQTAKDFYINYIGQNSTKDSSDIHLTELQDFMDRSWIAIRGELVELAEKGLLYSLNGKNKILRLTSSGWSHFVKINRSANVTTKAPVAKANTQADKTPVKSKPVAKQTRTTGEHTMVSFDGSDPVRMKSTSTKLWKEANQIILSGAKCIKEKDYNYYLGTNRPWYHKVGNLGDYTAI